MELPHTSLCVLLLLANPYYLSGHYLELVPVDGLGEFQTGRLHTLVLRGSQLECSLRFWYYFTGPSENNITIHKYVTIMLVIYFARLGKNSIYYHENVLV